jgi:trehalose 6-phosphate phosphatase
VDAVEALVADPGSALIAVDYDGTLAPIVSRPEDATPEPGAVDVLTELTAKVGTVAVISGRPIDDLLGLAGLGRVPGIRLLGHYGLQQWYDGSAHSPEPAPAVAAARARLPHLLAGAHPGVSVEDKLHSLVIHTRNAADPAAELARLKPAVIDLAAELGLEAVPGRFVVELRPAGTDKGDVLRGLIDEVAATTVVYLGDDVGDLPAYAAIEELSADATITGMTVASAAPDDRDAPAELSARADLVLAGPTAVVAWLAGLAAMLG